jgi:hypothetical protein
VLTYLLAVLAACANATSSVLQRKANREVPRKQNLSPRLIWSLAGVLVAWGRRSRTDTAGGARRAAVLGVAAGSVFGLTAALMKGMTGTFSGGIIALLTHWQLYGMIATGVLGMFLLQSAMNAGRLIAAQPGLTLSDPIVSILWGVLVFSERVRGGWFILLAAVSSLGLAAAVVALARSPLLSGESARAGEGQPSARRRTERGVGR